MWKSKVVFPTLQGLEAGVAVRSVSLVVLELDLHASGHLQLPSQWQQRQEQAKTLFCQKPLQ